MSIAFLDDGGSATDTPTSTRVPSRYLIGSRFEGAGADRVRYDQYSDGTEEGPFEDPVDGADSEPDGNKPDGNKPDGNKPGGKTVTNVVEFVRDGRRVKRTTYSDGTFEDEDLGAVGPGAGTTGGPRFIGTNPELLSQLQGILAELRGFAGGAGEGFIGGGEEEVAGFISGRFSFEDVAGALNSRLSQARNAVRGTATGGDDGRAASDAAFRAQQRSDAFSRIKTLLARFGLGDLEAAVQNIITSGAVDLGDPNAIIFAIRGEDAYKRRFAGNAARAKRGLPELDPSSYIGLEESYRQLMQSNGLPVGFYDQLTDFQRLIEGDVSPSELQERIEQGYRRVRDADPEVKRQMRELYGVDDNALTAYFLDPDKAAPLLTRQARAAQISARGREQAGLQLTAASAEDLAARGITPEQAQEAFARRGQLEGLYQPLTGEEALTEQEALGATFGYDVQAQQRLERRRAQRVGEFQAGGGFARTTGATSGTVETGIGTAQ